MCSVVCHVEENWVSEPSLVEATLLIHLDEAMWLLREVIVLNVVSQEKNRPTAKVFLFLWSYRRFAKTVREENGVEESLLTAKKLISKALASLVAGTTEKREVAVARVDFRSKPAERERWEPSQPIYRRAT